MTKPSSTKDEGLCMRFTPEERRCPIRRAYSQFSEVRSPVKFKRVTALSEVGTRLGSIETFAPLLVNFRGFIG